MCHCQVREEHAMGHDPGATVILAAHARRRLIIVVTLITKRMIASHATDIM